MFKISFIYLDKNYTAKVTKVTSTPVRYIVSDMIPYLSNIPLQLPFESSKEDDTLIYCFYTSRQEQVLTLIGESIFKTCQAQHINVHK